MRDGQRRHAGEVEQGRHHVDHMAELAADRAAIFELVGPRYDKADPPAAAAGIGLVRREGSIRDLRPARRVDRRTATAADPLGPFEIDLDRQGRQSGIAPVEVQGAGRARGIGAAIVGRENYDRIVELAQFTEQCHEAADILVGAVEHRGIGFHVAREELAPVGGNLVPGGHGRVTLGEAGARRNHPQRHLALKARGANSVPARIVTAAIFRQVRLLGLQRPVHRIIRDIKEEGPGRTLVADLGDKTDRLVHPIVGRVVALRIFIDGGDDVVVKDARRKEVPGFAFEEPVEAVKSAISRPGRVG